MATQFVRYPSTGGVATYANLAAFPASASNGTLGLALDTDTLYAYNTTSIAWIAIASPTAVLSIGTIDSQAAGANGATLNLNALVMQSASATVPGLVNNTTQSFSGAKTFTGAISASNLSGTNTGNVTIGTANGLSLASQVLSLAAASTSTTGALTSTDWNTFNGKQAAGNYITDLTGDATASGPGSAALTFATVNSNVGSFGSSTSIPSFTVNAKGLITAASGNVVIAPAGTLTGTTLNSTVVTSSLTSLGVQAQALNMGSHLINNVTDPSAAQDVATKAYVDTAVAALQPLTSVYAATTANIAGTYLNGVAGVGATFTTTATGTFTVDGVTPPLNSRVLIKDQSSGLQNGVYTLTTAGGLGISAIFTRTLDYNTASDMNAAGLIPVINGTVNALSSWQQVAIITTVGTDSLVFTEFTANPSLYLLKANNLNDVASASTAFNNINPMTTTGDMIYEASANTAARLPIGSSGQVLQVVGGIPAWTTPATVTIGALDAQAANATGLALVSNVLSAQSADATHPGLVNTASQSFGGQKTFSTGITGTLTGTASGNTTYSANQYGVVLSGAANAMSVLAPDSSTAKTLISGGTGANPAWGTLAIGGGGTGQVTKAAAFDALSPMTTSGDVIYGGASGTGTRLAKGSDGQVLTLASGVPSWAAVTATAPTSQVYVSGGNGYGSNNTTVRRFGVTPDINTGSDITYADSSTNGGSFTINTTGIYTINYSDSDSTGSGRFGITQNGSALTTSMSALTFGQGKRAIGSNAGAGIQGQVNYTGHFTATDVVRAQTNGGANDGTDNCIFNITRVA